MLLSDSACTIIAALCSRLSLLYVVATIADCVSTDVASPVLRTRVESE